MKTEQKKNDGKKRRGGGLGRREKIDQGHKLKNY